MVKKIVPTEEQANAIQYCLDYINNKIFDNGKGYIFISGQAGVGKSEIQKFILSNFKPNEFELAAYTAKAARVMEDKSGYHASTIHKLMYKPVYDEDGDIIDWIYDRDRLKKRKDLKFILIDECSMMTQRQLNDLKSSGKKIIVFGDYYQLPPINAPQIFSKQNADIILSKIHRQAEGNPLIQHLSNLRKGIDIPYGNIENKLIKVNNVAEYFNNDVKRFLDYDQIICGTNATRTMMNKMIREIKGIHSQLPVKDERLICLKNNQSLGIANGDQMIAMEDSYYYDDEKGLFCLHTDLNDKINANKKRKNKKYRNSFVMISDLYDEKPRKRISWYEQMMNRRYNDEKGKDLIMYKHYVETDFAYAISCHKSQGSEWKNILIIDESDIFSDIKYRWLYTAVSRGKESVTIVRL